MSALVRVLLIALPAALAAPATADTIYLTNGRMIRSEAVRITGDRVVFSQYGGEVSIPIAAVARIVKDDEVERSTAATSEAGEQATGPGKRPDRGSSSAGSEPAHPSHEPEYWIERIREVDERIARAQRELARLPDYDDVDRFLLRYSGQALYFIAERDKWEDLLRRFEATRRELVEGARQAGITPGALRDGLKR